MVVSKTELEQMLKDGRGRPSVVKYLVERELGDQPAEQLSIETKEELVKTMEKMVHNWPNSMESIFSLARSQVNAVPFRDTTSWWHRFLHELPAAAKEWL